MGYQSLSHYTSLTSEQYLTAIRKLGYSGYWMEVNSNGGTAFSDALLGNRYILRQLQDVEKESILSEESVYWNHHYLIQKLSYRLPSALVTDAEPGFLSELPDKDSRIEIQQALAEALFPDAEGLFEEYPADGTSTESVKNYTIDVEGEQILYFDCAAVPSTRLTEGVNKSCQVLVNGESIRTEFPSQSENGLLELGTFEDETVTITVRISKKISPAYFGVFGLDTEKLETLCEDAAGSEMQASGNRITVSVAAEEGQTLFLPVSWDRGWSAAVNGKKVSVSRAAGTFITLPLEAGENEVVLSYTPPGLWVSLGLMGIGLLLAVWFFLKGQRWLLQKNGVKTAAHFLFLTVFLGVLTMVYLFPMIIYFVAKFR